MYEHVKAEYFSFGTMTDDNPSPPPATNYREIRAILEDLKIQFKTLLSKKGKTLSTPSVSRPDLFRRNFLHSPVKNAHTPEYIEPIELNDFKLSLVLHGSMWSWKSTHESSWISSIVSYNLVAHEDAHYEFEIKTQFSEDLFTDLLPEQKYSDVRVSRRYKEFQALYDTLQRVFPFIFVPTLPPKRPKKLRAELTAKRKLSFELWLSYLSDHPILRHASCVLNFLISEEEWRRPAKEKYSVAQIDNLVTYPAYSGVSSIDLNLLQQLVKTIAGLRDHFKMERDCLQRDLVDLYLRYADDLTTFARLEKDLGKYYRVRDISGVLSSAVLVLSKFSMNFLRLQ
ncbi:unnamed protein product [Rodentolepis nana]|uniref:PX domain-containing protein n=1 Tax=Rodentolepis nana TaxID=102285 RepID=A0A0R3TWC8_RODNA|nr:unnamed protein product [Rodentolepis nana]